MKVGFRVMIPAPTAIVIKVHEQKVHLIGKLRTVVMPLES